MMVAASTATPARNPSVPLVDPNGTTRPPLFPSGNATNAAVRRPRIKDVASRYLSSYSPSPSSSSSTVTSGNTTTSSSSCSSSSSSLRRFPSPLVASRPSALSRPSPKRSQSVDRTRPVTPRSDSHRQACENNASSSEAARILCKTTRSLSVSFQGESFFYQTSKAKAGALSPLRKPIPEKRRSSTTPERRRTSTDGGDSDHQHVKNSRPGDKHRWPSSSMKQGNFLTRSLDCSLEKNEQMLSAVRSLQQSMAFDGPRTSFDGSVSSDTESVSSGSNSMAQDSGVQLNPRVNSRGFVVPARFLRESNSRLQQLSEKAMPLPAPFPSGVKPQKLVSAKKLLMLSPMSSPRLASSPLRGPVRSSSPGKVTPSSSRAFASPSRMRNVGAVVVASPVGQPGPAPSILTFAAEVRRTKNGENKIEEAHLLRLLYNRHLQWYCVNARVNAALTRQRLTSEKNLYNAWVVLSEMRDSVTLKRIMLHACTQNLRLSSILNKQMLYLEECSHMDREHSISLSGAIDALKASTLRLPVVGARADIKEVKEAIGSAFDGMQAMGSSICILLSKVEGRSSLVSELTKVAAQERALLTQARGLLSLVAEMHVKHCSLQGELVQLKRKAREMQL